MLLIEDHPPSLLATSAILENAGYRVLRADSGERAFDLLRQIAPDVVVTDLRLPGMSGTEVVADLCGRMTPEIGAVLISAADPEIVAEHVKKCPVPVSVVHKPLHSDEFLAAVWKLCPPA